MIKEIKYNGYTATPSDYECPDGDLAAAINIIPEEGALKIAREPEVIGELETDEELLLIHVVNSVGTKHLIIKDGNSLYYRVLGETTRNLIKTYDTNTFKCSATGNVLCVYGIGEIEHFLFLRGKYYSIGVGDYAISVLFGLEATPVSRSQSITGLFTNANGASVATWSNVVTQTYSRTGTNGINVYCNLEANKTYRFHLTTDQATTQFYIGLTLYDENNNWVEVPGNQTYFAKQDYYEFTPTFNVVRIYALPVRQSSGRLGESNEIVNLGFDGTITIDKIVNQIQPNATYLYNSTETTNNALLGIVNALLGDVVGANKFALPFFVRYGFRMIGGDIVTVSPPILMEPNTGVTPVVEVNNITPNATNTYLSGQVTAKAYSCKLKYMVRDVGKLRSLLEIEDLIDSLVIAVSDPIYMYKQGATQTEIANSVYASSTAPSNKCYALDGVKNTAGTTAQAYLTLPSFSDTYVNKLAAVSTFKIIKEISKNDISLGDSFVDVPMDASVLTGLSGNTTTLPDNVESLSTYDGNYVMSYNEREHLLGVRDCMFKGFDLDTMCGYVAGTAHGANYKIGCRLRESEEIQYLVRGKKNESSLNRRWFYYPNEKAVSGTIYENNLYSSMQLTRHPHLKGAYKFNETTLETSSDTNNDVNAPMQLISENASNMLYVSVQGNPIVIDQRVRVGDGILYAAAANVKPITRNQFGTAPLYAFSSDGIWGLEVSSEGKYSVRQAVARDVLATLGEHVNIESITPIDGAVLFATERGIILLAGSEAQCISQAINSEDAFQLAELGDNFDTFISGWFAQIEDLDFVKFMDYVKGCRMLYDYVHQCVIVYNPQIAYAYVYSLEQKKWGMRLSDIMYGINSYPDAWAVNSLNEIINLSSEPTTQTEEQEETEETETQTIKGLLITRPLKLGAPDLLKTVDTIIQRGKFEKGHVKTILYGSRDLFNWHLVYSSTDHYLRGFRGTPYKYFRIVLLCDLAKDESIFGCTVQYTPRLLDQPR
ncbi:MAG: hypothetical protein IJS63_09335 [Bacteroidaceae bacterium]|nr:hypothetical protein [Bacteroidaceae bacterium]